MFYFIKTLFQTFFFPFVLLLFVPDHPHCHSTALVFSLYTRRGMDSDDSYARPLIHVCAQPIVWFERERKLSAGHRAETRQTFVVLFSFFYLLLFCIERGNLVSKSNSVHHSGSANPRHQPATNSARRSPRCQSTSKQPNLGHRYY